MSFAGPHTLGASWLRGLLSALAQAVLVLLAITAPCQSAATAGAPLTPPPPLVSPAPPASLANDYPFYMPMQGLRPPAVRLYIKCDASRAAGKEVYAGRDAASLFGRAEGGYEFVYQALDSTGHPCVYPFSPWLPQVVGSLDGTQYILRSDTPGRRATFRTNDPWASVDLRLFDIGAQRVHFEMRDIELDFPGAIQPMGALHLEATGATRPGLFTAVIRRSKIFGGKNALFVPSGATMLYAENSDFAGNVGTNVDQEHTTYINGTLVSHFRNCRWQGQHAGGNIASGHQLKDKAYLRVYENVTVSNEPGTSTPSAMPLIDASAFGFTWSNNLRIRRVQPAQAPRDGLVDLRSEIVYGAPENYPWSVFANPGWRMPSRPLTALGQVYLSVFLNTSVESFRTEPYVFRLSPQGTGVAPGTASVVGNDRTSPAEQRTVALAFHTAGRFARVFSNQGWTFTDPTLPPRAGWVTDRDAFIRHALGLIGR